MKPWQKPRICLIGQWWQCLGDGVGAVGKDPAEAYRLWKGRWVWLQMVRMNAPVL